MGNSTQQKQNQFLDNEIWKKIVFKPTFTVLRNCITKEQVELNIITPNFDVDFDQSAQIYQQRRDNTLGWVKCITYFKEDSSNMCKVIDSFVIITQRVWRLQDIHKLQLSKAQLLLKEGLIVYKNLINRFGFFELKSTMIGTNKQGKTVGWINQNFALNSKHTSEQNEIINQEKAVLHLHNIISKKTKNQIFDKTFQDIKAKLNFNNALNYLYFNKRPSVKPIFTPKASQKTIKPSNFKSLKFQYNNPLPKSQYAHKGSLQMNKLSINRSQCLKYPQLSLFYNSSNKQNSVCINKSYMKTRDTEKSHFKTEFLQQTENVNLEHIQVKINKKLTNDNIKKESMINSQIQKQLKKKEVKMENSVRQKDSTFEKLRNSFRHRQTKSSNLFPKSMQIGTIKRIDSIILISEEQRISPSKANQQNIVLEESTIIRTLGTDKNNYEQ